MIVCPFAIKLFRAVIPAPVGAAFPAPTKIKVLIGGAAPQAASHAIKIALTAACVKLLLLRLISVSDVGTAKPVATSAISEIFNAKLVRLVYPANVGSVPKYLLACICVIDVIGALAAPKNSEISRKSRLFVNRMLVNRRVDWLP